MAYTIMVYREDLKREVPHEIHGDTTFKESIEDWPKNDSELLINWIKDNIYERNKTYLSGTTSYGLKHYWEKSMRKQGLEPNYITNNTFKDAMLICGFQPKDTSAINWVFKISKKSPIFKD